MSSQPSAPQAFESNAEALVNQLLRGKHNALGQDCSPDWHCSGGYHAVVPMSAETRQDPRVAGGSREVRGPNPMCQNLRVVGSDDFRSGKRSAEEEYFGNALPSRTHVPCHSAETLASHLSNKKLQADMKQQMSLLHMSPPATPPTESEKQDFLSKFQEIAAFREQNQRIEKLLEAVLVSAPSHCGAGPSPLEQEAWALLQSDDWDRIAEFTTGVQGDALAHAESDQAPQPGRLAESRPRHANHAPPPSEKARQAGQLIESQPPLPGFLSAPSATASGQGSFAGIVHPNMTPQSGCEQAWGHRQFNPGVGQSHAQPSLLSDIDDAITRQAQVTGVGMNVFPAAPVGDAHSDRLELIQRLLAASTECTMIVRHLPHRVSQGDLLKLWDARVLRFNYLLQPYSTKKRGSTNYCFINFATRQAAMDFQASWSGAVLPPKSELSSKTGEERRREVLEVSVASVQGFWPNVLNFAREHMGRLRPVFYPAVFDRFGRRLDFEATLRLARESSSALSTGEQD